MTANFDNINALIPRMAAIFLLSFGLGSPASADVYRWLEADGTVNYGEHVPDNLEYTVVSRSKPAKAGSRESNNAQNKQPAVSSPTRQAGANPVPADDNLSDRQRSMLSEIQAAEAARQAAVSKMRQSNCETSRRALSTLQASGRIRVRNDAGEESTMTEEDRSERISQAQKSVVANCDSLS